MKLSPELIERKMIESASDILYSDGMEYEKKQRQHGSTTCFIHSLSVAYMSVKLASVFHLKVNTESLIRGALLHDYFLYDWRDPEYRLHGFRHARTAFNNASSDFNLNKIEGDIILRHMFPLNLTPPRYKESALVCLADKICATLEILAIVFPIKVPAKQFAENL